MLSLQGLVNSFLLTHILIDVHTEAQAEGIDDLTELIERLTTEVTEREQLALIAANELADGLDVRRTQAVLRTN